MSCYRTLLLASYGVLAAVLMVSRGGSSQTTGGDLIDYSDADLPGGNLCGTQGDWCSNDEGAENPCVSFANDIQPIFDNRCVRCHNADLMFGGLNLSACSSYANLVCQPTSPACRMTVPDSIRIVPADPESSMLWLKTRPDDRRCGVPMPRGTDGLGVIAPDEFLLIETWILQGAQNN